MGEGPASVLPSFCVFFTQENLPLVHSAIEPSFGAAVLVGLKLSPSHTGCVELIQADLSVVVASLSKVFSPATVQFVQTTNCMKSLLTQSSFT